MDKYNARAHLYLYVAHWAFRNLTNVLYSHKTYTQKHSPTYNLAKIFHSFDICALSFHRPTLGHTLNKVSFQLEIFVQYIRVLCLPVIFYKKKIYET